MANQILVTSDDVLHLRSGSADAAMDFASLAGDAARQSQKLDLGATRPARYRVRLRVQFDVAPTAGGTVDVYWAGSDSATAGTNNAGDTSGTNASYKSGEEDEWVKQLDFLGSLIVTNDAGVLQVQDVAVLVPYLRYGMAVVHNKTDQTLASAEGSQGLELHPLIDELQ